MFKKLMFTFGCVILRTANVWNRFIKRGFFVMATLKQSTDKEILDEWCLSSLIT